ncbi:MAG: cytochrome c3 family protein [Burkholderiales bacterium]|nr:cytochrome c3 family protein [Burkholderiales bacterium]
MTRFPSFGVACALFALLFAASLLAAAAPAAAPTPGVNDTCLMCHADKDAKSAAGTSIAVDAERFRKSVHGELQLKCTDCHTDVSAQKLPHAEKLQPVNCGTCHDKVATEYAGTVHGIARKGGNTVAASCTDCHGTHDILRAKDPASPTNHANIEAMCSKCHGSDAVVAKAKLPGGNIGAKFHDSIHGKALKGAAQGSAPTCTNCHGVHDIRAKGEAASHTSRANIPDTCGTCHKSEREAFLRGQHGKLRQDGNLAAPGCTDCHSAHEIQSHDAPQFHLSVIKECGTCHQEYLDTYRDTFHGQVTALGYVRVATCASCHGAHEVLPASNPASKVSPQNRLATCQTCHAGATANFASFDPHANRHDKARNPLYYYVALFMEILLWGVFSFFGIHTLFWFYRELRVKFGAGRKSAGSGREKH